MPVHYIKSFTDVNALIQSWGIENYYVITDHNCETHCVSKLLGGQKLPTGRIFSFEPGEKNKTLHTFENGIELLSQNNLSRKDCILNIGGGITTDLGGFVAACYKRGIDFINIPTSLLAMVDAAHGGKVGVNHKHLKNYIGSFKPAKHTIICPEFLKTLPSDELESGFAEMLKHGLIADSDYWHDLISIDVQHTTASNWLNYIKTSIDIKSAIVSNDPLETGERKILNFGHTVGHAIESHLLHANTPVHHGNAVAAGMVIEAHIGIPVTDLNSQSADAIKNHILSTYGKIPIHRDDIDRLIELMLADKKNHNDNVRMSLLNDIGDCGYDIPVSEELMRNALLYYIDL